MQSQTFSTLLIFLLLLLGTAYYYEIDAGKTNYTYTDYGKFYQSVRFELQGKSLYTRIWVTGDTLNKNTPSKAKRLPSNLNPPFFELLILPLGYLSYAASLGLWTALSIASGILSIFLLQNILSSPHLNWNNFLLGVLALFAYYPTFANIQFGQLSLLLLPFLAAAWLAARHQLPSLAAIPLAFLTSIKPFFALFALYFFIRREWSALFCFVIIILFCALLPLPFFGIKSYLDYYATLHQIHWYASSWNASLYGFLLRLFGNLTEKNIPLFHFPTLTSPLYRLFSIALIITLIKFLWPTTHIHPNTKIDLDFSLIIVASLLLSPLGWLYYFPFLIIPFSCLALEAKNSSYPIFLRLLTALAIVLSSLPYRLIPSYQITNSNLIFIWSGCYFYALALTLGLIVFMYTKRAQQNIPSIDYFPKQLSFVLYLIVLLPSIFGIIGQTNNVITYQNQHTSN